MALIQVSCHNSDVMSKRLIDAIMHVAYFQVVKQSNPEKGTFARAIQDWRARKKLSQAEAAQRLGFSLGTIRNWEQERNTPHPLLQEIYLRMYRRKLK